MSQTANLLKFIEERLEKKHNPDPDLVKKHNADPLNKDWQIPEGALWEQSDVVHDILAFLAEQMKWKSRGIRRHVKEWLAKEVNQ
ncbi:hypothetical protein [Candidatus Hakubella thermalkaliphila]|nr:hypothetical protein [Candidatus Hakubella thermalkaliphila]